MMRVQFLQPSSTPIQNNPILATVGDLDGDGDLDLTVGSSTTVTVLLNTGEGEFSSPDIVLDVPGGSTASVGDLDGDGDLDLATADLVGSPSSSTVLINDGAAQFLAQAPLDLNAT